MQHGISIIIYFGFSLMFGEDFLLDACVLGFSFACVCFQTIFTVAPIVGNVLTARCNVECAVCLCMCVWHMPLSAFCSSVSILAVAVQNDDGRFCITLPVI